MKHYFFILFMAIASIVSAQIPTAPKTLLSPTATSLGIYGEVPVSCYTGTPSIEVPLYELKTPYLTLPITLSYHPSLVRPDLVPGPVGLGWTLNAGGVISRVVNGIPDDYKITAGSNSKKMKGYYYDRDHSFLNRDSWNTKDNILGLIGENIVNLKLDTEPDEFSFNFLGYHGKFMLNHKGEWTVQCDKPVKVEFDETFLPVPFSTTYTGRYKDLYFPSFSGFTLTAEDGVRYVFGGDKDLIDYSIDFFGQDTDDWVATSWYLNEIIMPNNDKITFNYNRCDFTNQMVWAFSHTITSHSSSSSFECSGSTVSEELSYQGKLISPVELSGIRYSDISISFSYGWRNDLPYENKIYHKRCGPFEGYHREMSFLSRDKDGNTFGYPDYLKRMKSKYLRNVSVYSTNRINGKMPEHKFDFVYKNSPNLRLLLDTINVADTVKTSIQTVNGKRYLYTYVTSDRFYKFEYNSPELLPEYLSKKVDHWGYYNGREANFGNYAGYESLRNSDAEKLQYGVLKKITYPTGGYTRFVFEPHSYRKKLTADRSRTCENSDKNEIAGGLRIKQIINSADGSSETVTKEYFYVSDYLTGLTHNTSSGVLGGNIMYNFPTYNVTIYPGGGTATINMFSSQSVLPCCENTAGCHIGYSSVVERNADNSFTIYRYSNFDTGTLDSPADFVLTGDYTPYEPYNSKSMERGHLLSEEIYDANKQKKSSRSVTYQKSSDNSVRLVRADSQKACSNAVYYTGVAYQTYMYNYRILSETKQDYEGNSSSKLSTTIYSYDDYNQLKNLSQTVTGGKKSLSYKYAYEFNSQMKDRHILSPISEVIEGFAPNGGAVQQRKQTLYTYVARPEISAYCFPLLSIQEGGRANTLRETYVCHAYDSKGNPTYVTCNGELDIVYVWDKSGRYIIAEIINTTNSEVESALNGISGSTDFERMNGLRAKLPQAQISTFDIHPLLGIMAKVDPQGQRTEYRYDKYFRLKSEWDHDGRLVRMHDYLYSTKHTSVYRGMEVVGPIVKP